MKNQGSFSVEIKVYFYQLKKIAFTDSSTGVLYWTSNAYNKSEIKAKKLEH